MICCKQLEELQPLPIPIKAWDVFSMDFIPWLPKSVAYRGRYDLIIVVVDKLSKMCHYTPCRSDMTAGKLAKVVTQEVIQLHGVSSAIISDCGSLFSSWLWANLMYSFRIEQQLSTAFHPPTDGQTKRQNSVLEQYLLSYINYQQDDWSLLLALAEFAYNPVVHSSTSKVPFEIVYGEVPRSDMLTLDKVQKYTATRGSSAEGESLIEKYVPSARKSQNSLRVQRPIKPADTINPIAMWSTKSAKKFDSGLRTSQSSDRHESWICKNTDPIASLKG